MFVCCTKTSQCLRVHGHKSHHLVTLFCIKNNKHNDSKHVVLNYYGPAHCVIKRSLYASYKHILLIRSLKKIMKEKSQIYFSIIYQRCRFEFHFLPTHYHASRTHHQTHGHHFRHFTCGMLG